MRHILVLAYSILLTNTLFVPVKAQTLHVTNYQRDVVGSIAAVGDTVYYLTDGGTYQLDKANDSGVKIGTPSTYAGQTLHAANNGAIWSPGYGALLRYTDGQWESFRLFEQRISGVAPFQNNEVIVTIDSIKRRPNCEGNGCLDNFCTLTRYTDGEWNELYSYSTGTYLTDGFYYLASSNDRNTIISANDNSLFLVTSAHPDSVQTIALPYSGIELYQGAVSAVMIDQSGDLQMIWDNGELWCYDMDMESWDKISDVPVPADDDLAVIDLQDRIWIGTSKGLKRYDSSGITTYTTEDGLVSDNILSLCLDTSGTLWIGTDYGISSYFDAGFTSFLISDIPDFWSNRNYCIGVDNDNSVLFVHYSGIVAYQDGGWSFVPFPEYVYTSGGDGFGVYDIDFDSENNWWFGTNKGVLKYDGSSFFQWTEDNSTLPHYRITDIDVGYDDCVRVIVNNSTVSEFTDGSWNAIDIQDAKTIVTLQADNTGGFWITGKDKLNRYVHYYKDGQISHYLVNGEYEIYGAVLDSNDNFYMAYLNTDGIQYLGRIAEGHVTKVFRFPWFLSSNDCLHIDNNDTFWIYNDDGIAAYDGTDWILYNNEEITLLSDIVYDFTVDHEKNIWVSTYAGVTRFAQNLGSSLTEDAPGEYQLSATNFPNPFNPQTTISFSVPENGLVDVSVYNIAGQKITSLLNKHIQAGLYQVVFDGAGLPSGIYFYQIHTQHQIKNGKMLLLK